MTIVTAQYTNIYIKEVKKKKIGSKGLAPTPRDLQPHHKTQRTRHQRPSAKAKGAVTGG
jgi:hypothetical protein